jgi:hypothetical protein
VLALVLASIAATACTSAVTAPHATALPSTPPALATAKVEQPTFALTLSAPAAVSVGAPASVQLSIEGRGEYHVNHEYPIQITLRAPPEVSLAASELVSADAKELVAARARFETQLSCHAAGSHRIEAHLDFALCTERACTPESRDLALTVHAHD